jgi:NitT/TauT family transport system ATP-binding protein
VTEAIRIQQVSKIYQSRTGPVHALGPVDLDVHPGEFISIVGPSGCGKSTLMLMIAGLLDITGGTIEVNGKQVSEPQTDIGIVFQSPVLVDWRTVLGNVMLQVEMRKLKTNDYIARAHRLLASVGLQDFESRYPFELSGGMQQRTAFCRALVHDPPLILMDEPLGALDAMTREQLRVDLELLWMETRKTVIFVTHSITESVQLSDRVVVFTPRPGMIDRVIDINLPRPRSFEVRESVQYNQYVHEITNIFMGYGIFHEQKQLSEVKG